MKCANLQLTDYDADGRPALSDMAQHTAPLSELLTMELDGAAAALGVKAEELLLAALGRAIDRTIGDGEIAVDVDADLTGNGATVQALTLTCAGPAALSATEVLAGVHRAALAPNLHHHVADLLFTVGASAPAGLGHALELHVHRTDDVIALDWWFDTRSFETYTVEELAEQFPLALVEITSEASSPVGAGRADAAELALA